jgi:hypothetical protein
MKMQQNPQPDARLDLLEAAARFAITRAVLEPFAVLDRPAAGPTTRTFVTFRTSPTPLARVVSLEQHEDGGHLVELTSAEGADIPPELGVAVAAFMEGGLQRLSDSATALAVSAREQLLVVLDMDTGRAECLLVPPDGRWWEGTTVFALTEDLAEA